MESPKVNLRGGFCCGGDRGCLRWKGEGCKWWRRVNGAEAGGGKEVGDDGQRGSNV